MGLLMDRVPRCRVIVAICALIAAFFVTSSYPSAQAAPASSLSAPSAPATVADKTKPAALQDALRAAVAATRSKLGTLQPWQQLLFTSEVLLSAENFVREFRPQGAGYKVDVDETMVRNYLAFFGPKVIGMDQPVFLARIEADELPSEAEFVASLRGVRQPGPLPVLEASPEQLERFPAPAPAKAAAASGYVPSSYPPLESPSN